MTGTELKVILNFIAAVIYLIFGLFVFHKNKKSATNIFFGYVCLTLFLWAIVRIFYMCSLPDFRFFAARLDYAVGTFMGAALIYFALIFPSEKFTLGFKKLILLFLPNIFIFFISFWENGLIRGVSLDFGQRKEIIFNPFWFKFYIAYYAVYFLAGLSILFKKCLSARGALRHQFFLVVISFLIAVAFGFTFNLILVMPGIDIFAFTWLGPLTSLFLPIFMALAISKHHLMNIRLMGTELFACFIFLLFLAQLLLSKNTPEFLIRFFLLFLIAIFGFLLVRGILREEEETKKTEQIRSEFISIVSHQLRSPLTAIKGYISLLLDGTYGELDSKITEVLKKVSISNARLIRLVNELLNVSLMDFGKLKFEFQGFSLENLVSMVVDELKIEAYQKNILLCWEKPEKPLSQISGDPEKLYQAILNIVDNAIKYTERGTVSLKIKEPERESKNLLIVSDTGIGIEKNRLKTIFAGFSRGERVTKMHTEGTGLGLAFSAKIIRAHGGKIWAESEGEGKGSTFYIELPINPAIVKEI